MKRLISLTLVLIIIFTMVGCGTDTSTSTESSSSSNGSESTKMLLGTSSSGGTYYVLGGGWSKLMNDTLDSVDIAVEVTGGPNTNIQLIEQGDMELGFATTWLAGEAWTGEGWAEGKEYKEMRTMYPMYSSIMYIYALKDSGIESIYDLEGKNVSVGAPGATSDMAGRAVLEVLYIEPKSIISLPSDTQISALKDGNVDANFGITGLPAPWLLDLETTHEIQYIPLEQEDMDKILEAYPYWGQGVVPEGTYKHQEGELPVLTFWNVAIADKDIPEDIVYNLVKTTFENHDDLVAIDPTSEQTIPENIVHSTVPLHPGALKYYEEIGIEVADDLIIK